jgi:hypothetical protein
MTPSNALMKLHVVFDVHKFTWQTCACSSYHVKNYCARKESMLKPISFLKPKVIGRVAKKKSTIFMISCHLRAIYQQQ